MHKSGYLLALCGAIAGVGAPAAWSQPQMTARELFYSAAPSQDKTPAPAVPAKKKMVVARKPTERAPESAQTKLPDAPPPPPAAAPSVLTSGVVITASMRTSAPPPANGTPLGLKYTLLKLEGGSMTPVAPDTVFHAHDSIQFSIETNGPGYLYIVGRGSSGKWMPMFPSAEIANGDNHVEGFHNYTFPEGYRFSFDEQVGAERLFLILSRDPKPDFEQLVYSLQGRTTPASEPAQPAAQPQHKMLMASASIDDPTIDKMRTVYARDLVIEKVGDQPSSDSKEKATFVVNASGAPDSCVVADLTLAHR